MSPLIAFLFYFFLSPSDRLGAPNSFADGCPAGASYGQSRGPNDPKRSDKGWIFEMKGGETVLLITAIARPPLTDYRVYGRVTCTDDRAEDDAVYTGGLPAATAS